MLLSVFSKVFKAYSPFMKHNDQNSILPLKKKKDKQKPCGIHTSAVISEHSVKYFAFFRELC